MWTAIKWAGGIAAGWVVLYLLFWLHRSGCFGAFTLECNGAPIRGLGDFVMLEWVRDYQTILGGLFALSAGAFVIGSAKIAATSQQEAIRNAARGEAVSACAVVAARFTDAAVALQSNRISEQDLDFAFINALIVTLSKIDTMLATVTQAHIRDTRNALIERKFLCPPPIGFGDYARIKNMEAASVLIAAQCYAMREILYIIEENVDAEGRFNFKAAGNLRPGVLRSNLKYLGVDKEALGVLRHFFNWDDHSPKPRT